MVVHFKTSCDVLQYGQFYVALSRVRSISNLFKLIFEPKHIRANPKTHDVISALQKWNFQHIFLSLCSFNVCRFRSSLSWLKNDEYFNFLDVNCFQEKQISPDVTQAALDGYTYVEALSDNRF